MNEGGCHADGMLGEPFFSGHLIELGFIAGIGAIGTVVVGDDGFALGDEGFAEGMLIPIERRGVAIGDDVEGRAVRVYSAPFAVEDIEVELLLLDVLQAIPSGDQFGRETVLTLRVNEFHELEQRLVHFFIDHRA